MMPPGFGIAKSLAVWMVTMSVVPLSLGQGVGPNGPSETEHVLESVLSIPEDPVDWAGAVGSADTPVVFGLDPAGLPWVTHFRTEPVAVIQSNQIVELSERIAIGGDLPWTRWEEEILTAEFDWIVGGLPGSSLLADGAIPPGSMIEHLPRSPAHGARLRFSFDALGLGTQLWIVKKLVYTGAEPFEGVLSIREFPVPEPTTGLLVVLAGAWLLWRGPSRRRPRSGGFGRSSEGRFRPTVRLERGCAV